MKFSVLISEYKTGKPEYLNRAISSIWDDQILKPNQIVIVKDGPLGCALDKVISDWKNTLDDTLCIVDLKKNVGLGDALAHGLSFCKYNIIARMDSDDISLPNRFLEQINYLKENHNIDILGSNISEFNANEDLELSTRIVPSVHKDIVKFAKLKNPFNHPSVMYKKDSVINSGGPKNYTGFDDYYLWVRMIMDGCQCANIDVVLLKMRLGNDFVERRGGFAYLIYEYKFQTLLFKISFISLYEYIRNLFIRIPVRIMPKKLRNMIYNNIRKK
jgi:glycosyltransferase involved in cell wall biosynthesis